MDQLSFQYPIWYVLLCLLLGLALALLLYFRDHTFRQQSRWLNWVLGGIRFLGVSLAALFLLSPLLRTTETDTRKPVIVLAQDVSESTLVGMSAEQRNAYLDQWQAVRQNLQEDFRVEQLSFGAQVREGMDTSFSDKVSNISALVESINDRFAGDNLGALVLASDGIYNEGSNPVYSADQVQAPIYTVALGDTTPKRDLVLRRIFYNRIAYLGDQFKVQVDIAARNLAGQRSNLVVYKVNDGAQERLSSQVININSRDFFTTAELTLDADEPGVQRYRLALSPLDKEVSRANNTKDFFIDVLDARQQILILASAPHPDLTALRQSISVNKNYETTVEFLGETSQPVEEYDFVVLHQIPDREKDGSSIVRRLQNNNIPHLYILGMGTDFQRFNQLQSLLSVQTDGRNTNDAQAQIASNFNLFTIGEELRTEIPKFPPMTAPFGEFSASAAGEVLLYQRIRKIDTEYPLLLLGQADGTKQGMLVAEGIWRWRLFDYLQRENHELFDEMISKVVQYVSLKEDKRKFRVSLDKVIFNENEQIFFDAELYNNSYELINTPDATLQIVNEDGNEFDYAFDRTENAYRLNAGSLPVGNYRYSAEVIYDEERLTFDGEFSVQPIQLELYETTADHQVLRLLSQQQGGELLFTDQLASLPERLREKDTIKPVIYNTQRTQPLINIRWFFAILLILFTAEWFLRRYFGAY